MPSGGPQRRSAVTDDRFTKSKSDPRFRAPAKTRRKKKFEPDPRFAEAEKDPAFCDDHTEIDKYGRWIPPSVEASLGGSHAEKEAGNAGALEMQRMVGLYASPSESESESDESLEEDVDDEAAWGVGAWAANPDETVSETEATNRIAVVDMDWSKISAMDLLATFRSFVPNAHTAVKKVTVYLSDYGIERLPKEEKDGPSALGIFKASHNEESRSGDEDEVNAEVLRKYEKSRLRYYYAVVECGSVQVAEHLMQELDGSEFETSQCVLDLRYIADDESFEDRPIKDEADTVASDFEALSFECNALQKTNVKLTWDEDDGRRLQVVRRRFTEEELQDHDFRAYLASESERESSDEDQEMVSRQKYASLVESLNSSVNPRQGGKTREKDDSDSDVSVSESESDHCLESLLEIEKQKKVQKDGRKIWNAYEKRKSERVKKQKRRGQFRIDSSASDLDSGLSSVEEEEEEGRDALLEDPEQEKDIWIDVPQKQPQQQSPVKAQPSASNGGNNKQDEKHAQTNMELLMMDDQLLQNARTGHQIKEESAAVAPSKTKRKLSRKERARQSIDKKKQKRAEEQDLDFKVNVDDPRFSSLFTSTDFALDPTHPAFKRTLGADTILQEVRRKKTSRSR